MDSHLRHTWSYAGLIYMMIAKTRRTLTASPRSQHPFSGHPTQDWQTILFLCIILRDAPEHSKNWMYRLGSPLFPVRHRSTHHYKRLELEPTSHPHIRTAFFSPPSTLVYNFYKIFSVNDTESHSWCANYIKSVWSWNLVKIHIHGSSTTIYGSNAQLLIASYSCSTHQNTLDPLLHSTRLPKTIMDIYYTQIPRHI